MTGLDRTARRALTFGAAGALGVAVVVGIGRRRFARTIDDTRAAVESGATTVTTDPYNPADVANLPAPARRYLETVLEPGQPHVDLIRLAQTGDFRLGDADSPWLPFEARQVDSVAPPAYVWDAEIRMAPLVSARVFDAYVEGQGRLRAALFGALPVASAGPDARMNEAELQRYLSETPWFPTALLPAAGVTWAGIDDERARATVTDGDVTASAVFHVAEDGHLTRITADRYRQDVGDVAPWTGTYSDFETRNGMVIPTTAEVGWETEDGYSPYWRGRITEIEHVTGLDDRPGGGGGRRRVAI